MRHKIIAESSRAVPWKNGRGTTIELADSGDAPALWRLSLATIAEDGPFSDFTGYDRTIVPLDDSITLQFDDGECVEVSLLASYAFDGGRGVTCRLKTQTVRAFNVMSARGAFTHDVEILGDEKAATGMQDGDLSFLYRLDTHAGFIHVLVRASLSNRP